MAFVRSCLEIAIHGFDEPFVWGVWGSLSNNNFEKWASAFELKKRAPVGPFFGWLHTDLSPYPATANLKALVHVPDEGLRFLIALEPTEHPLALEQRTGISIEHVIEITTQLLHGDKPSSKRQA